MIEVRWELEADGIDQAAAAAAVERILNYYQRVLTGITCPRHAGTPWLVVRGRAVKDLAVSLGTCCSDLKEQTDARMRSVSRRDPE